MKYKSTRDTGLSLESAEVISAGISKEGGLFVPEAFPSLSGKEIEEMAALSYIQKARKIIGCYLTDFSDAELSDCIEKAYTAEKFVSSSIAPLVKLSDTAYILELWHGPTCAFKDMALQLLPHLLTVSAGKVLNGKSIVILVATSGDTGKAALEGFKDVPNTKILVFYPSEGVSAMQKLQMTTQDGENVHVAAILGNFDDAQSGVKNIFTSEEIRQTLARQNQVFSSANSINWGRLVPQIVYYFSAYCDLLREKEIKAGEKINVVVPTGNFGNILAAYYAYKMGLPVHKFICASNKNNILTDFIRTGVYDKNRPFYPTCSPSMDILISSNLERLLFDLTECDEKKIKQWFGELAKTGAYEVDEFVKQKLFELFYAGFCDDEETKATIRTTFTEENYLLDTHTAVALNVYRKYMAETGDDTKSIIASTASPYKFPASVLEAVAGNQDTDDEFILAQRLSDLSGTQIPDALIHLRSAKVRFTQVVASENMVEAVKGILK